MKAIQLVGRENIQIVDVDDVQPGVGEVAVAPDFVGLCGTDLHVFLGEFEERVPYPAIMGHEVAGRIVKLGDEVEDLSLGDRVVVDPVFPCGECPLCRAGRFNNCSALDVLGLDCAGALAECFVVDSANIVRLPDSVKPEHGIMAELYSVAVHASRLTGIETGDIVVIIGTGRLGLSLLDVMRRSGAASIIAVDILDERLAIADALGADETINASSADAVDAVMKQTNGLGADKVIEAVGHHVELGGCKPPMGMACEMIRPGGQITAMGQGEGGQPFDWRELVLKEGRVITSRLNLGDMPRAVDLMARGHLHPEQIITQTVTPDEVQSSFDQMHDEPGTTVKVVVDIVGFRAVQV